MSKIFLDTNVRVYGLDTANPDKQNLALNVLASARAAQHEMVVSTQILQEFYHTVTRKLFVSVANAKKEMLLLTNYHVVLMRPDILSVAADLHATASVSFWDALVVAAAQSVNCDEIWTEDMQAGRLFGKLRVVNPLAGN